MPLDQKPSILAKGVQDLSDPSLAVTKRQVKVLDPNGIVRRMGRDEGIVAKVFSERIHRVNPVG
jgi:hypothetical protein